MDSPARRRIWRHNSFLGHAKMMEANLRNIAEADSTSSEAKRIARLMLLQVALLAPALKERIDP